MVQASKKITGKRLKWYGHVRRMKEEHIVRIMLSLDKMWTYRGKDEEDGQTRWKDACKRPGHPYCTIMCRDVLVLLKLALVT